MNVCGLGVARLAVVCQLFVTATGIGSQAPFHDDDVVSHRAFETAAFRIASVDEKGFTSISPSGSSMFVAKKVTLSVLIGLSFGVEGYQVSDLPKWSDSIAYDVTATAEGHKGLSYVELQPALQSLLKDRLRLETHWISQKRKGYRLQVKNGNPRTPLEHGTGAPENVFIVQNGLIGSNVSVKTLAAMIAHVLGSPVVDETGLDGTFNLNLHFASSPSEESDLPSLPASLEECGLALKRSDVAVKTLVIDHVEKVPREN